MGVWGEKKRKKKKKTPNHQIFCDREKWWHAQQVTQNFSSSCDRSKVFAANTASAEENSGRKDYQRMTLLFCSRCSASHINLQQSHLLSARVKRSNRDLNIQKYIPRVLFFHFQIVSGARHDVERLRNIHSTEQELHDFFQ